MTSSEGLLFAPAFERRVRSGATAKQIADEIASALRLIHGSLAPIIGVQGVAALYRRSLTLTSHKHTWLAEVASTAPTSADVSALTTTLSQQKSQDAAVAGGELLQTFHGLVARLIGTALTRRLLASLWQTLD